VRPNGCPAARARRAIERLFLACSTFALITAGSPATAGQSLTDVFSSPRFAHLGLAPLGPALASTVASTYPVASASSSVSYVYNHELDTVERRPGPLGPILGERAVTVGQGQFDLALTYSFVDLTTINGEPLDHLVNAPLLNGRFLFFPVPGGTKLKDGRFTTLLPVHVALDIGVDAHILSPSVTYGVTPDLDVNLTLPIVRTSLDMRTRTRVPDPRFPSSALPPGDPLAGIQVQAASASSVGVGDLLLRAKYVVWRGDPVDVAAGLGLSLPTGRADDFQGAGTTRVEPGLIASRVFGTWLELLANVGIALDAEHVGRSVVQWAIGGTVMPVEQVAVPIVFLGRDELGAPAEPIPNPFFFQIERSDIFDASIGIRWRFAQTAVLSANALVPLNREGLRADVIPTVEMEYTF
jgi:Putative MetA-pathway of phenol degradation